MPDSACLVSSSARMILSALRIGVLVWEVGRWDSKLAWDGSAQGWVFHYLSPTLNEVDFVGT